MKHTEPLRLDIERYFTGELVNKEAADLEEHIQQCSVCHQYLQSLRRQRNEFLADHPFSSLQLTKPQSFLLPWYQRIFDFLVKPVLYPVYGLLLIVSVFVPVFFWGNGAHTGNETRFKGASPLSFLCQRDGVVCEGDKRKSFRAGDRIQIRYNSAQEQFIALLSIDSRGQISYYHPEQLSEFCSIKSAAGTGLTFPGSIILDDSKGFELIIVLFSDKPLRTEIVSEWISEKYTKYPDSDELEKAIIIEKPGTVSQISTLLLHKE